MELLLFLIFIALVVIIFKLSKIIKTKDNMPVGDAVRNKTIDEKIKTSESILKKTYPNHEKIYKKIESFEIDIEYLEDDLDFNAEYFDCGVIRGEVAMFKDLEAGELDTTKFLKHNLEGIKNALIQVFPHIKNSKREDVAKSIILKNKK